MEINEEVAEIVKHVQTDTQTDSKAIVEIQKAIAEVSSYVKKSVIYSFEFRLRKKETH